MEFKKLMTAAVLMGAVTFGASVASAKTQAQTAFNDRYLTDDTACTTCHNYPINIKANTVGAEWTLAGGTKTTAPTDWAAFDAATGLGSDVDPAWSASTPAASGSGSSGGGCVTSTVVTPLMMVLAMLTLGFFVRRKED